MAGQRESLGCWPVRHSICPVVGVGEANLDSADGVSLQLRPLQGQFPELGVCWCFCAGHRLVVVAASDSFETIDSGKYTGVVYKCTL